MLKREGTLVYADQFETIGQVQIEKRKRMGGGTPGLRSAPASEEDDCRDSDDCDHGDTDADVEQGVALLRGVVL